MLSVVLLQTKQKNIAMQPKHHDFPSSHLPTFLHFICLDPSFTSASRSTRLHPTGSSQKHRQAWAGVLSELLSQFMHKITNCTVLKYVSICLCNAKIRTLFSAKSNYTEFYAIRRKIRRHSRILSGCGKIIGKVSGCGKVKCKIY